MQVLWVKGTATAEEVRELLPDHPHDSTVRTMLRVLKNKGYVRIRGRQPAAYEPKVARSEVQTKATRNLLARLFGGSAEALVQRLVEDEELSQVQLDQLRKELTRQNRRGGKS
jgi:predicted transcriptional regulator